MMSGAHRNSLFLYDRALGFPPAFRRPPPHSQHRFVLFFSRHIRLGEKLRFSHINAPKERKRSVHKKKRQKGSETNRGTGVGPAGERGRDTNNS